MNHLIVGAGEVGRALHQLLPSSRIRDVQSDDRIRADTLHIAFPWTGEFVRHVKRYQILYRAPLVVVHSTVPVGTCDPCGWVHSPVRGRHPDLVDGLKTFTKWFGGQHADDAAAMFAELGVPVRTVAEAATTEAAKLWELVQFGVQVKVMQAVWGWCDDHDADPSIVYRQMAETYNDGYVKLGHPQFTRPVLTYRGGGIGGHCVKQGAALLDHDLARWVAE